MRPLVLRLGLRLGLGRHFRLFRVWLRPVVGIRLSHRAFVHRNLQKCEKPSAVSREGKRNARLELVSGTEFYEIGRRGACYFMATASFMLSRLPA